MTTSTMVVRGVILVGNGNDRRLLLKSGETLPQRERLDQHTNETRRSTRQEKCGAGGSVVYTWPKRTMPNCSTMMVY